MRTRRIHGVRLNDFERRAFRIGRYLTAAVGAAALSAVTSQSTGASLVRPPEHTIVAPKSTDDCLDFRIISPPSSSPVPFILENQAAKAVVDYSTAPHTVFDELVVSWGDSSSSYPVDYQSVTFSSNPGEALVSVYPNALIDRSLGVFALTASIDLQNSESGSTTTVECKLSDPNELG